MKLAFTFVLIFLYSRSFSSSLKMSISTKVTRNVKRIFCYGDSLTAGTSPPFFELHPYGPHLEQSLQETESTTTTTVNQNNFSVQWFGLPGWTASSMVDNRNAQEGLQYHLNRQIQNSRKPDLTIILAGTNDLAYQPSTDSNPTNILNSIICLHKISHDLNVPTLAVGIPPSGWQAQSSHARKLATDINLGLKDYCDSIRDNQATFIEFPISTFTREPLNDLNNVWAPDGLHFSPHGYQVMGKGFTNAVLDILK